MIHGLVRAGVWSGAAVLVSVLSRLRGFEVPADGMQHRIRMVAGTYERETMAVCRQLIRRGASVIDVGAHAGYFTLAFARLVRPGGRVLAFEPHPRTFEFLRRNLGRHGLENVVAVQKAVGDRDGQAVFYETPVSLGHSLQPVKDHIGTVRVATTSLDSYLGAAWIDQVTLVKVDVEGGEPEVLDGLAGLARRAQVLSLILEFKPYLLKRRDFRPSDLLRKLYAMGFSVYAIRPGPLLLHIGPSAADRFAESTASGNLLAHKGTLPPGAARWVRG